MDRKQIAASVVGLALVGGSLFGAISAASGSDSVTINQTPAVVVPDTSPLETPVQAAAEAYDADEYGEAEYHEYEDHAEYEDHDEHAEYEDHDEHEGAGYEDHDEDADYEDDEEEEDD